jgi:hypothetical protein
MKNLLLPLTATLLFASCSGTKDKAKELINETGQTVGKGATEFVKGVGEGIDETLQSELVVSDNLKAAGLQTGKFKVQQTAASDSLTVYVIFNKDFKQNVTAKVYDAKGSEYGRSSLKLEARANDARYVGFAFDPHTDFESKSRFVVE